MEDKARKLYITKSKLGVFTFYFDAKKHPRKSW